MRISGDEGVAMGAETQGAGAVGEIFDVEDVIGADVAGVLERGWVLVWENGFWMGEDENDGRGRDLQGAVFNYVIFCELVEAIEEPHIGGLEEV